MKFKCVLFCICAATSVNALACFTVYDRANRVLYHAQQPPVDMRYQIHQTLPGVFPGGHMVFDDGNDCPRIHNERAQFLVSDGASPTVTIIQRQRPARASP